MVEPSEASTGMFGTRSDATRKDSTFSRMFRFRARFCSRELEMQPRSWRQTGNIQANGYQESGGPNRECAVWSDRIASATQAIDWKRDVLDAKLRKYQGINDPLIRLPECNAEIIVR